MLAETRICAFGGSVPCVGISVPQGVPKRGLTNNTLFSWITDATPAIAGQLLRGLDRSPQEVGVLSENTEPGGVGLGASMDR